MADNLEILVATFEVGDYCGPYEIQLFGDYKDYFEIRGSNLYLVGSLDEFNQGDTVTVDICSVDPVSRLSPICDTYSLNLVDCNLSCVTELDNLNNILPSPESGDGMWNEEYLISAIDLRDDKLCSRYYKSFYITPGIHFMQALQFYYDAFNFYENVRVRLYVDIDIVYANGEAEEFRHNLIFNVDHEHPIYNLSLWQSKVLDRLEEGDEFSFMLRLSRFEVSYTTSIGPGKVDIDLSYAGIAVFSQKYIFSHELCPTTKPPIVIPTTTSTTTTTTTTPEPFPYWLQGYSVCFDDTLKCNINAVENYAQPDGNNFYAFDRYVFSDYWDMYVSLTTAIEEDNEFNIDYTSVLDDITDGQNKLWRLIQKVRAGGTYYYVTYLIFTDADGKPIAYSRKPIAYGGDQDELCSLDKYDFNCYGCFGDTCTPSESKPVYNMLLERYFINVNIDSEYLTLIDESFYYSFRELFWVYYSCENLMVYNQPASQSYNDECNDGDLALITGLLVYDNSENSYYDGPCSCLLEDGLSIPCSSYNDPTCQSYRVDLANQDSVQRYSTRSLALWADETGATIYPDKVVGTSENCTECLEDGGNNLP